MSFSIFGRNRSNTVTNFNAVSSGNNSNKIGKRGSRSFTSLKSDEFKEYIPEKLPKSASTINLSNNTTTSTKTTKTQKLFNLLKKKQPLPVSEPCIQPSTSFQIENIMHIVQDPDKFWTKEVKNKYNKEIQEEINRLIESFKNNRSNQNEINKNTRTAD